MIIAAVIAEMKPVVVIAQKVVVTILGEIVVVLGKIEIRTPIVKEEPMNAMTDMK